MFYIQTHQNIQNWFKRAHKYAHYIHIDIHMYIHIDILQQVHMHGEAVHAAADVDVTFDGTYRVR